MLNKNEQLSVKFQREVNQLLKIIVDNYQPKKVILFGSVAFGKLHPESDLDVCLLKDFKGSSLEQKQKLLKILWDQGYDYNIDPDFHVYTPKYFEKELQKKHPFLEEIQKGQILYER